MQAITTKFLGATNFRGSRIVAKCDAGRRTVEWDYGVGVEDNHHRAAQLLIAELGWDGLTFVSGSIDSGNRYAHVLVRA